MPHRVRRADFEAIHAAWSEGRLTQAEAADRLEMSTRTFRRFATRLLDEDWKGWAGDTSAARASDDERRRLESLYSDEYAGWNVRHFYEKYVDLHDGKRSYTWVKNVLQAAGLVKKRSRSRTGARVPSQRGGQPEAIVRQPREGMMLRQIASRHPWVAGCEWDLFLLLDDATNKVHSGFFAEERGVWPVFRGIREVTLRKGLFRHLSMGLDLHGPVAGCETAFGGDVRPQVERAIEAMGTTVHRPDARVKMRNARLLATIQGRLPYELKAVGVKGIHQANQFLARYWGHLHQSVTGIDAVGSLSEFDPLENDMDLQLRYTLCLLHEAHTTTQEGHLVCRGREAAFPELQKGQDGHGAEKYRIHEHEGGACTLFSWFKWRGWEKTAEFSGTRFE